MALFPQLACQAPQMPQYLPWSTWLQRDPLKRWAPPGGAFPNLLPNSHFVIHGWGPSAEEGTGAAGGKSEAKDGHKTGAYPPCTSPNANSFALAERLGGLYLRTKVPEAGGLCITALSVSTTCLASAGRVADLSFRRVCRSQREHNGPHRPRVRQGFLSRPWYHQPFSPPSSPRPRSAQ